MDIQFVFKKANPLPNEKKSFGKGKKHGKIMKKGKTKMKKKAKKKFKPLKAYPKKLRPLIASARKRAKAKRDSKRMPGTAKSRNPYYTYAKGSDKKRGVNTMGAKARKHAKKLTAGYKEKVAKITRAIVKAPMKNKQYLKSKLDSVRNQMHKRVLKAEAALKQEKALRRAQGAERRAMLAAGYTAKFNNSEKGASKMAKPKKKSAKKKSSKKKSSKKKSYKKKSAKKKSSKKKSSKKKSYKKKSAKKKSSKKKSSKKKSSRKAKKVSKISKRDRKALALGRKVMSAKKGKTVRYGKKSFKRTNAFLKGVSMKDAVKQYLGMDNKEALSLVVGGAIHTSVNGLALKVPYANKLIGIPVIGPTILPLIVGILGKRFAGSKDEKKPNMADIAADGLIAASLVAIGVQGSSMIPGLSTMNGMVVGPDLNFGSFRFFPNDTSMNGMGAPDGQQMGSDPQQMGEQGNFWSPADMGGNWQQSESMT